MRHGIDRSNAIVANSVFVSAGSSDARSDSQATTAADGKVSLSRILPGCRFFSGNEIRFSRVAQSPDAAQQGELVVYRIGQHCPSKLVADALARGAAGILTEQILPCPLPQCIVADIELAMAAITAAELDHPDRKLLTVGVIGSSGKTSTTLLVSSLLRSCGIRTAYQSDLGECDGVVQSTPAESVPANASLVKWLGEAIDADSKAAIIELSDDEARHGHYDAIEFDLLIVTGSATCSGDYGPSGLQCVLERLTADGIVIAPADDTKAVRVIRDSGSKLLTYGVRQSADVTAKIIDQSGGMTTLLVTHQDTTAAMETSLCGPAMAANHAAAILVGLLIAQPLEDIVEKLSQLRLIPGRGHRLASFGHAAVVLDAGGSPDRFAATLRTYRSMKSGGRLWCVLAVNENDSPETLARYGSLMERFADKAIVTSQADSKSHFLKTSHSVLDGVERCAALRLVADRRRAIEWAISEAGPNDTILLVTGERNQTAVEQRADIERISRWVESARQSTAKQSGSDVVKLSIFG